MKRSELKKVIAEYQEINQQINQLEKKVNAWNMGNTVAAIIAAIMGFFGLKGS